MYDALQNNAIAGAIASPFLSTLFAVALLASGQNSTITGTLTGQIVMEGSLNSAFLNGLSASLHGCWPSLLS